MSDTAARRTPVARLETFTALGVVAVLLLMLAAVAWTRPTQTSEDRAVPYRQSAEISWSADTAPDSTYGVSGLQSGETVVLDQVDELRLRVAYALDPASVADVRGTAEVEAVVVTAGGLRRTFPVAATTVDGPEAVLEGVLPLDAMRTYLRSSAGLLGDAGTTATATVTLAPVVDVSGTLQERRLDAVFDPTVELVLTDDTLGVATDDGEPVLEDAGVLNPSEAGEIPYVAEVPARLSLLVADPRVGVVRWVAVVLLLGCLAAMAVLGRRLLGSDDDGQQAARLLGLHGSRIVSVTALSLREGPVAEVASFDDLLDLARRYDSMVMHVADADGDTFSVWDTGLTYRYRVPPATAGAGGAGGAAGVDGRAPQELRVVDDRTGS